MMDITVFEPRDLQSFADWEKATDTIGINVVATKDGASLVSLVDADGEGWLLDGGDAAGLMDALRTVARSGAKLYAWDANAVAITLFRTHKVWLRGLRDSSLILKVHEPDAKRFEMRDGYSALNVAPDLIRGAVRDLRSAWAALSGKKNTPAHTTRDWVDAAVSKLPLSSSVLAAYVAAPALLAAEVADEFEWGEHDEVEQAVEAIWRRIGMDGYTVDLPHARELLGAQKRVREDAEERHGIDLVEDSTTTRRWLARRGIEILDAEGEPSLSHKNFGRATVPDHAAGDFAEFVRVREATLDAGKLTEITAAQRDGIVRPRIDSYGAVTGRQAIRRPALQNIPEHLRPLLLAPEEMVLVGADLSHVEPSISAALSRDAAFIEDVQPGHDPYLRLAETIWDEDISKSDPRRQIAKRVLLASGLYGQGITSLAYELDIAEREADRVRDGIFRAYPEFAQWRKDIMTSARKGRELTTGYGRLLASPHPDEAYKAVNYVVQGTAADYFKRATLRAHETLGDLASLYLPIHDELIVACVPAHAEDVARILTDAMTDTLHGVEITADATLLGERLRHA